MPNLVIVVFCVRLPDEDQPLAIAGFLDAVTEGFPHHHVVLRDAECCQAGLELLPTRLALRRRIGHAEGLVMDVRRSPKPVGQRHMRPFMQFFDQGIGARLSRIHAVYPSINCYKPGRFSAVTDTSIGLLERRTSSCRVSPASTWHSRLASRSVLTAASEAPLQARMRSPTFSPAFSAGRPLRSSRTT